MPRLICLYMLQFLFPFYTAVYIVSILTSLIMHLNDTVEWYCILNYFDMVNFLQIQMS